MLDWLDAGVRLVLVVDPQTRSARCYWSADDIQVRTEGSIDLSPVIEGCRLDIADLFA